MVHIRLKKALSYSGIVKATKNKPDVYVNKDTAQKAVESGYFEIIDSKKENNTKAAANDTIDIPD